MDAACGPSADRELDLEQALRSIVEAAAVLVDAEYAALGVIGLEGKRLPPSTRPVCPRSRSPGSARIRRATASTLEQSPVASDEPGAGCARRLPWC